MTPSAVHGETFRFEATDARADGQRRTVSVSPDLIVISRRRQGMLMRIALEPRAFLGVALSVVEMRGTAPLYEVKLLHRDADFSVPLYSGADKLKADAAWKGWARFVGAPALIERAEGRLEEVANGRSRPPSWPRRRPRGVGARRPRFLVRRKVGHGGGARVICEHELFGAFRDGL